MGHTVPSRWPAQEEAVQFALDHPSCMLDMEMGTGKTRVAIDVIIERGVGTVLVVCPKAVMGVWPREMSKYAGRHAYSIFRRKPGETVRKTTARLWDYMNSEECDGTRVIIINYDSVWRKPLGDYLLEIGDHHRLDMVVLDESHRAKAAGSKVSKYLSILSRRVPIRMCLSGTPMANSPLDVYGQYRFLDKTIYGTNYSNFLQRYAIMGGPERNFVVGYRNQQDLIDRFRSIAYTCRMSDISDMAKLPPVLPPVRIGVELPRQDMQTLHSLEEEFISECDGGFVVVQNVLVKMLRMQQICAGFCPVQDVPLSDPEMHDMNTAKADALRSVLQDLPIGERVVVFCVFRHDLDEVRRISDLEGRPYFELSGREHSMDRWYDSDGGVMAVQIQAGAEGVDMTCAHHAIYFSLPHSLALYEQSKARLYRPGQDRRVSFIYLIADGTIDEGIYDALQNKRDVIDSIQEGTFDFGYFRRSRWKIGN